MEMGGAPAALGLDVSLDIATRKIEKKSQEGAHWKGEVEETEKGRRRPLLSPESRKSGGGRFGLRRAFPAAWRHDSPGKERGMRKGIVGSYRGCSGRRLMPLNARNQGEQFPAEMDAGTLKTR